MVGKCLVISPFLPKATDAGHRKRTFESCQSISDIGYDVTLVHLAFEGTWFWRRSSVDHFELKKCGISAYHEIYVDDIIGRSPNGSSGRPDLHALDEWWHPALEAFLTNYLRRNYFEVVVVHNVWLSKAFDFVPSATLKIIETHDLFSVREHEFAAIGAKQDFFSCSEEDEVFGLNRADICIGIKAEDSEWIARRSRSVALTVPPRVESTPLNRFKYLSEEKVVFGFMGSGHAFNVHALQVLLNELKFRLLKNPAPLEFLVAGTVANALDFSMYPFVKNLGFVKHVSEFYDSVDIVVSPLDNGTGLKIKVAEAIELEVPILATKHSASGTKISGPLLLDNVWTLAEDLVRRTNERLPYDQLKGFIKTIRAETIAEYQSAICELGSKIRQLRKRFVVFLPELFLPAPHPLQAAAHCLIRTLAGQGSVLVLCDSKNESLSKQVMATLPASVDLLVNDMTARTDLRAYYLDVADEGLEEVLAGSVFITSDARVHSLKAKYEIVDSRLSAVDVLERKGWPNRARKRSNLSRDWVDVVGIPLFSDSIWWDPNGRPPYISSETRVANFWRLDRSIRGRLEVVLNALDPSGVHIFYSDADELNDQLPRILRSGILTTEARMPTPIYSVEIALAEYLRLYGVRVKDANNCLADDLEERSSRFNLVDHEPEIMRMSINELI